MFDLGQVLASPLVARIISSFEFVNYREKHQAMQWEETFPATQLQNKKSIAHGVGMVISTHKRMRMSDELWIVTSLHRKLTFIIMSSEYREYKTFLE
jgi:hypothetical protein